MARWIDADAFGARMYHEAFEKDSDDQRWDSGCWIRYKMFERVMRETPAADVAPVRHGRWEPHVDYLEVKCSECGFFVKVDMPDQITKEKGLPNFCPHCGAKMDGLGMAE